jgi:hypothetical protein
MNWMTLLQIGACGLLLSGLVSVCVIHDDALPIIELASSPSPPTASMEPAILPPPTPFVGEQRYTAQPQGIVGVVLSLRGDFMPRILPEDEPVTTDSKITPVATKIWIFAGKVRPSPMKNWPQEFAPAPISPRLPLSEAVKLPNRVGWVMSDKDGRFQVGLPVGEYTLLAEYGDDLYLNLFTGDDYFATVQVKLQQITTVELRNTENATF